MTVIRPLDKERLRAEFRAAKPFPFVQMDGFLDAAFAREVADAYPSFAAATGMGKVFETVNEHRKLQVTKKAHFPPPVLALHEALSAKPFLEDLAFITGIDDLLADDDLAGGGMHQTGPHGRLDVHVDFNLLEARNWHRRLNILVYLNPVWKKEWGGYLELWDRDVKVCHHAFAPILNRCVIFETSDISFHGVQPLTCPPEMVRKSFAAYYYTAQAPAGWDGKSHCTQFRARPHERLKGLVLMPMERLGHRVSDLTQSLKRAVKKVVKR
jgi:hypothetical protein